MADPTTTERPRSPEPRRLYQQIADQLRALIHQGHFTPGSRLPAERDLAQTLGVSRPSLREALIALEIDGSVEVRMGSGVYVCLETDRSALRTSGLGESPSELMEARAALEGEVILLAAARITPDALDRLRASIEAMRADIELGQDPLDHDRQFHLLIAAQSGNSVLSRMVGDLFDERHSPLAARISIRFENRGSWHAALEEHAQILAGLEARDPLRAQSAMRHHLEKSRRRWVEE